MKQLVVLVLGLFFLAGCTTVDFEGDDMSQGNPQYAKSGGWSASGKLTNDGQSNMGLQANFLADRQDNPIPAKDYTIQFFVSQPSTVGFINPQAEISWSVEGNTIRRVVSVTNGVSVSGVGQAAKVVVRDQTPQGIGGITYGITYDVSVTIAPGSRPTTGQPPLNNAASGIVLGGGATVLTPFSVAPGALGDIDIAVPVNAGAISYYATAVPSDLSALTPGVAFVQQVDSSNTPRRINDLAITTGFIPLVPEAVALILINNYPPGPGVPNLTMTVSFGIDG